MSEPQTEPRCPYCDERLWFLEDRELLRVMGSHKVPYCDVLSCTNTACPAELKFISQSQADCRRQATDLKMVERVRREEREACLLDVHAEPELDGDMPDGCLDALLKDPSGFCRTIVTETKRLIAQRIRARNQEPEDGKKATDEKA